jgi:hypothetical protein
MDQQDRDSEQYQGEERRRQSQGDYKGEERRKSEQHTQGEQEKPG